MAAQQISAVGIAPPPSTRSPWILGLRPDLALFLATPLIIVPLIFALHNRWAFSEIAFVVASFGAFGHHLPGMLRAYGDRDLFERFKVRFILAPLVLLTTCITAAHLNMRGLAFVILVWGFWHGAMQVYGFLRIYDAKQGCVDRVSARLDWWMCVGWFSAGIVCSPGTMTEVLVVFYKAGGPLVPPGLVQMAQNSWLGAVTLLSLGWMLHFGWMWRRGNPISWVKPVAMFTSFGFWWFAMISVQNVILGIALFEIFHDVQYLSIVWVYNQKRAEGSAGAGRFTRLIFRRSALMIAVYIGLVLAYGLLGYTASVISEGEFNTTLYGLLATSGLLHFYYDGFIWKVRERTTRDGLGLNASQGERDVAPGWLLHGAKWSLFFVPIALLAYSQVGGVVPMSEQNRNLVAAVAGSPDGHFKVGVELQETGEHVLAAKHFRRAIAGRTEFAQAHYNLGLVEYALGNPESAEENFRLSIEAYSGDPEPHNNLGNILQARGKLEEAENYFVRAVSVDPVFVEAHFNLGNVYREQGKTDEAIEQYELVLKLRPSDAETYNNLGVVAFGRGNLQRALGFFQKAVQINPQHANARQNVQQVRRKMQMRQKARGGQRAS